MFGNEVTLRNKNLSQNTFDNKSKFIKQPENVLLDRQNISKSELICMQTLTPTSNLDEKYQKPRPKSVEPLLQIRNESSEATTSVKNTLGFNDFFDEILDSSNFNRSERHLARLNTQLLEAVEQGDAEKVERLIIEGANPNATCRLGHDSACHIAALVGGDSLSILLKYGADKNRSSKLGGTPMHMAAWAGNVVQIAFLLGLPEKIQREIESGLTWKTIEEKIRRLNGLIKSIANMKSGIGTVTVLAKTWKDSIEHKCKDLKLPFIETAWTPLHVASSCARYHSVRLLLAAGADPNNQDIMGQTPLDIAGSAFYRGEKIGLENFRQVIKILLDAGSKFHAVQSDTTHCINSPLHVAMELEYLDLTDVILAAGGSIKHLNKAGETPLHICIRKQSTGLETFSKYRTEDNRIAFDVRDKDGYTVLHAAVKAKWLPGVCIALENGADITLQANNGDASIHTAAELGDIDILHEILSTAKKNQTLDYKNKKGETALFKAIIHNHIDCVKLILNIGASVCCKLPKNFNILHVAAKYGHSDILEILLKHNDVIISCIKDELNTEYVGLGPIHLAAYYNHVDCVKVLLNSNANCSLKVSKECPWFNLATSLHIAANKNNLEIAKILLDHDRSTLHQSDIYNWTPLHVASYYGHEDIISLFIREGADITLRTKGPDFKKTCFDFIMNNISKPTQFMENIFNSYIYSDDTDISQFPSVVYVDYNFFTTNAGAEEQMKVVEALLKTGNRFDQKRLLVHPFVESFLYLNWVYLLPFFYIMLGIYTIYVLSLNIFIISTYFYKDTKGVSPVWLNPVMWRIFIYITGTLIFVQEILYMKFGSKIYFYRLESWIKLVAVTLAMVLPTVLSLWLEDLWPRHLATVALLLSWTEMMLMLSRFPNWGYYVLMFGKVLSKVLKILLTFVFIVIGFALSFMIQFHSQAPFNDPWAAFVKTMVMMTSEFDYLDLFDEKHTKDLAPSLVIIRILFLLFLILAGIVLMNLMVGVAVNDLNNLEIHGNIRRLEKQVEFLSLLESVVYNKFLMNRLPKRLRIKRKIINHMKISAVNYKLLPLYLRDAVFYIAQKQMKKREDNLDLKMDETHTVLEKNRKSVSNGNQNETLILDTIPKLKSIGTVVKNNNFVCKDAVDELKVRMEVISKEMEAVNAILRTLDNTTS